MIGGLPFFHQVIHGFLVKIGVPLFHVLGVGEDC